jgi:hypothetical protein
MTEFSFDRWSGVQYILKHRGDTGHFVRSTGRRSNEMVRRFAFISVVLLTAGAVGGSDVLAQPVENAFFLNAALEPGGHVELTWTQPLGDSVQYYLAYRGRMLSTLPFVQIDSTTGNKFEDTPPATSTSDGFVYYVQAVLDGGATVRSNLASVYLRGNVGSDVVRITSEPANTATVGVGYSYQVLAVSNDSNARLQYDLPLHPFGMSIDSTGLITWTPDRRGLFRVVVAVRSSMGGRASQDYVLCVGGSSGSIAGTVTDDSTGAPVPGVFIKLYGRDRNLPYEYGAITDSEGNYSISRVDVGTYLVRAIPGRGKYLEQWYDGVSRADQATPVQVNDTAPVSIDFKLKAKTRIPRFSVSGVVTDTAGAGIKGATVVFSLSAFSFNASKIGGDDWSSEDDPRDMVDDNQVRVMSAGFGTIGPAVLAGAVTDLRLDGSSVFVFKTRTDSSGAYSLSLPQGPYIAFAGAAGYFKVFYENHSDFLSADIIKLASDTSGIDFVLRSVIPLATGTINGSVIDTASGAGIPSRIVAFRDRRVLRDTLLVPRAYHTDTDSVGVFSLTELPPGDYLLLAIPLGHFVPSYYSTNGPTIRWQDATTVNVDGNTVAGITILVRPTLRSTTGYTSIGGNITSSSSEPSGSLGKRSAVVGVDGSLVYATDNSTGLVGGYGVTDASGSYTIPELAPGTYSVTVDKVDYSSATGTANPTYDASGNPVPDNVSLSINSVVTGITENATLPTGYTLMQNYPNPFNPMTQIAFTLPQAQKVTLSVYNILGQKVATLVDGVVVAGMHVVTWNARDSEGIELPSGVYFYRLAARSYSETRKMVLLK